jgi:signal transduction histidine kinase
VGVELNRLHTLVDDLLYLARADEGAPRTLKTIDLADLVFDEAERVAATSQKHIDASGVVPVGVRVEPSEAARAIRNLLENAERFAAQSVTLAVVETGAMATLIVADDGPGIAPEDRDTVFERFARVHTDRARSAGGTGLGLSIVASIVTANGGAIVLTDAPSGGAQFELSFPVNS